MEYSAKEDGIDLDATSLSELLLTETADEKESSSKPNSESGSQFKPGVEEESSSHHEDGQGSISQPVGKSGLGSQSGGEIGSNSKNDGETGLSAKPGSGGVSVSQYGGKTSLDIQSKPESLDAERSEQMDEKKKEEKPSQNVNIPDPASSVKTNKYLQMILGPRKLNETEESRRGLLESLGNSLERQYSLEQQSSLDMEDPCPETEEDLANEKNYMKEAFRLVTIAEFQETETDLKLGKKHVLQLNDTETPTQENSPTEAPDTLKTEPTSEKSPLTPQKDLKYGSASQTLPARFHHKKPALSPPDLLEGLRPITPAVWDEEHEPAWRMALEMLVPFMIASIDVAVAGIYLQSVESWDVFQNVPEVFILIPALLGLRGNIMMTLASRLSTLANMGQMDSASSQMAIIGGNLALTQVQAVVVGLLASLTAMLFGWLPRQKFDVSLAFLMCVTAIVTAVIACLVLGLIVVTAVLVARKFHANPDNVATSLATSLGDCATLALLSTFAHFFYGTLASQVWLAPTVLCLVLALTPVWCTVAYRNPHVHQVLFTGWFSIIGGMLISSVGGTILDFAVQQWDDMAYFQPLMNGVGGNLAAIQASRLSTSLHAHASPGHLPDGSTSGCPNPLQTFFGRGPSSRSARVLMAFLFPDHIIFVLAISFALALSTTIPAFTPVFLLAAGIQVAILLYIADWLVHLVWRRGGDPDNITSPFLTALADLLGSALLAFTFFIVFGKPQNA